MSRTLVISDTHIGDPRYADNQKVQNLLRTEDYDRLVLNGDIVDLWLSDIKTIMKDPLYQLIKEIASEKETIWCIGNHDYKIELYKYCGFLPRAYLVDSVEFDENDHKVLIIHGHQIYNHKNKSWLNRLVGKINCWIWKYAGIDIQSWLNTTCYYKQYIAKKRKKIIEKYGSGIDTIIIGHTHHIGYSAEGTTTLFDIGSSIKTRSYAIIDDGTVWIKLEH